MWEREREMFCPYILLNKETFENDYSETLRCKYDFCLSGKKLTYFKKRHFCIDLNLLDEYENKATERELKDKISKRYNIDKESLYLGAGINGLLQNLIKCFINSPMDNIVTPFFTFKQVSYGINITGAQVRYAKMENDFYVDFECLKKSIDSNTRFVFICNPNNPTGVSKSPEDIINFSKAIKIPVIVSEASVEFSRYKSLLTFELPPNLIVLRSFSKEYGLSGIRLGYAYIPKQFKNIYLASVPQHQYSKVATIIANELFDDLSVVANIKKIKIERNYLRKELESFGIETLDSDAGYLMTKRTINPVVIDKLYDHQISVCVVNFMPYKLFLRIAINTRSSNNYFIEKLKTIKGELDENFFSD